MREILAIFVANKAVNVMTESNCQDETRNVWFRLFRACFWLSLSSVCVSVAVWAVAYVFSSVVIL